MTVNNIASLLLADDRPALVAPDGSSLSYAEFGARVGGLAGWLATRGVGPGDRIVLLLPMGFDLYTALLALFHVGATAVLVDPAGPLAANLAKAQPTGLIGVPQAHLLRLKLPTHLGRLHMGGLKVALSTGFTPLPHRRLDRAIGPSVPVCAEPGPALLSFTTGTTGTPKGMLRSHTLLLAQHRALLPHMPVGPDEVDLPTLPVFLLHALAGGATCVIADADLRQPGAIDGHRLLAQMAREGVTSITGSPSLFAQLIEAMDAGAPAPTQLKRAFLGGARVPAPLLRRLLSLWPQTDIYVVYGSTEAEPIAALDARAHIEELEAGETSGRGILVGSPVNTIDLRIEDDELWVAGAHVNPGYLDDPTADAETKVPEVLADGSTRTWHRTGDAGFVDQTGRIWLVGRRAERIDGQWPLQVEAMAEGIKGIRRAALGEKGGRAVLAVELIGPSQDIETENALARAEARLGLPVIAVERIPLDPRHNAKIDRKALFELLALG